MLKRADFNNFCSSRPSSTHVVQWGNADVWKVGGKVFAIGGWNKGADAYTFKVGAIGYEVLTQQKGIRPAPYMASRGMKWIQVYDDPGLRDDDLLFHIQFAYQMAIDRLTKKQRAELGLA